MIDIVDCIEQILDIKKRMMMSKRELCKEIGISYVTLERFLKGDKIVRKAVKTKILKFIRRIEA